MAKKDYNYLFVSDLHVAMGVSRLGEPSTREDFFFDDEFQRFLKWHSSHRKNNRPWELVFVGDCFDFLPIQLELIQRAGRAWNEIPGWEMAPEALEYLSLETIDREVIEGEKNMLWLCEQLSVARLAIIETGHPVFFEALGEWLGEGNRITFVRGNHDIELAWPSVQSVLRQLISRAYEKAKGTKAWESADPWTKFDRFDKQIQFFDWFYYKPGLFYAEHGFQYEMFCASPNIIRPFVEQNGTKILIPDMGGIVVNYIVAPFEDVNPTWENNSHPAKFLLEYVQNEPEKLIQYLINLKSPWNGLRMASRVWKLICQHENDLPLTDDELRKYAGEYVKAIQTPQSEELIFNFMKALNKIPGRPPLMSKNRLSWFLFSPMGHVLKVILILLVLGICAAALIGYYMIVISKSANLDQVQIGWNFISLLALAAPIVLILTNHKDIVRGISNFLLFLAKAFLMPRAKGLAVEAFMGKGFDTKTFLYRAAGRIHEVFTKESDDKSDLSFPTKDVPQFYIFGHDHRPAAQYLKNPETIYFNTGAWFPSFNEKDPRRQRTGGSDVEFTFLQIVEKRWGKNNRWPEATLLRWNDAAGAPTRQIIDPATKGDETRNEDTQSEEDGFGEPGDPFNWEKGDQLALQESGTKKKE